MSGLYLWLGGLLLGGLVGITVAYFTHTSVVKNAYISGERHGRRAAADIVKSRADFEMSDTEGPSVRRFANARTLFEIELELRSQAGKPSEKV